MNNVKIEKINETTYEDGTVWIGYSVGDKTGYEISTIVKQNSNIDDLTKFVNKFEEVNNIFVNKPTVDSCGEFLAKIINDCRESDNEMWFVEFEDLEDIHGIAFEAHDQFLEDLDERIVDLGLQGYINTNEDGCAVTVYGGVITKFLF